MKKKPFPSPRLAGTAIAWTCAVWLALSAARAATVAYPALGNILQQQGTIEMWITPLFDPCDPDLLARAFWGTQLLDIREDDRTFFNLIWRVIHGRSGPYSRHQIEGHKLPVNWLADRQWGRGKPRHIAYCWTSEADWWILDGVKRSVVRQRRAYPLRLNETRRIAIGCPRSHGQFVMDDLRISSRPRREDEVGFHFPGRLRPDAWTLLLDTFDVPPSKPPVRQTKPILMMPSMDGALQGGLLSSDAVYTPSVSGAGLQL